MEYRIYHRIIKSYSNELVKMGFIKKVRIAFFCNSCMCLLAANIFFRLTSYACPYSDPNLLKSYCVIKMKSSRSVSSKSMTRQKKKSSRKSNKSKSSLSVVPSDELYTDTTDSISNVRSVSIGHGSFSRAGVLSVTKSSRSLLVAVPDTPDSNSTEESIESSSNGGDNENKQHNRIQEGATSNLSPIKEVLASHMPRIFIRTADLPRMKEATDRSRQSFSDLADDELVDHIHKPSSNPPLPSLEHDTNESWVALDDGNGAKAPLASAAIESLVNAGLSASMNKNMWTPNGSTPKLLKTGDWDKTIFLPYEWERPVPVPHTKGSKGEKDVLVWSGTWSHKYYGHDLPAIRCEAIVNMSPKDLADLLVDSTRVKEYNKMSAGRDDILVLHDDENCVTKVCIGRSKVIGKTLMLKSLLHMEQLPGGGDQGGYVIVSRAVAYAGDSEVAEDPKIIHSEMLMGLNVIRPVEGEKDRCVLINVNHLRSPMIPMMLAKRLGLSSAVNFINDIRALC